MKHNKRAQSALEFLTTYGWAFLVISIMIAALAYLGVLNPSTFLGDSCTTEPGFTCRGVSAGVSADNQFQLEFVNALGGPITITNASFYPSANNPSVCNVEADDSNIDPRGSDLVLFSSLQSSDTSTGTVVVTNGADALVTIQCGLNLTSGVHTGVLTLTYTRGGSNLRNTVDFQIRASP